MLPPHRKDPESLGGDLRAGDDDCAVQAQRHRNNPSQNGTQAYLAHTIQPSSRAFRLAKCHAAARKSDRLKSVRGSSLSAIRFASSEGDFAGL
jgi:hypothetical protein